MLNLLQCKNKANGQGVVRNIRVISSSGARDSECVYPGLEVDPS